MKHAPTNKGRIPIIVCLILFPLIWLFWTAIYNCVGGFLIFVSFFTPYNK